MDVSSRHLNDPATGKPRLLTEQCATCFGRPDGESGLHLRPGRRQEVINGNRDGLGLICHETIAYNSEGEGEHGGKMAFCRWFYDHITSNYQRICERLGGFCKVPPPPDPRVQPDTEVTAP